MSAFDRNDTVEKVVFIIAKELKIDSGSVVESTSFKDLGADSLDLFEIILRLEETFGLEISDDDAETITTVKAAIDHVCEHRVQ